MGLTQKAETSQVVAAARNGDQEAWHELFIRFMPLLLKSAHQYRLGPEEAADIIQVTWLRCLEHADQLNDVQRFAGWIAVICRRECLAFVNRRRREISLELVTETTFLQDRWDGDEPCLSAIRQDEAVLLRRAIARLPYRQRLLVQELMEHHEDSYAEVAARLRIPLGSIGPTRQRALARLRDHLRSMGVDVGVDHVEETWKTAGARVGSA